MTKNTPKVVLGTGAKGDLENPGARTVEAEVKAAEAPAKDVAGE